MLVAKQLYVPSCFAWTLMMTSDVSPLSFTSTMTLSEGTMGLSLRNHLKMGEGTPMALQENLTLFPADVSTSKRGVTNLGGSGLGISAQPNVRSCIIEFILTDF
jgi:hypothetical protein